MIKRIRYFSDLHLEFIRPKKIDEIKKLINPPVNKEEEVCILAGDIGDPYSNKYKDFMEHISTIFSKTFVISGNHEYYNYTQSIQDTKSHMVEYFNSIENITFLDNELEIYKNYCFIGTTLWSKITNPNYEINDVYNIPNFDYKKYNKLNKISVDFLENSIKTNNNCIVITHHVPSHSLIDNKYLTKKMNPYNQWFYCDLDHLITNNSNIKVWIYGHTHTEKIKNINGIQFLCNPIGYPNENKNIDLNKIYEFA